jgi:KTSC domain
MNRIPVSSSNLASIGYDPVTQTLEIEFLHGGIYQYSDVPSSVYNGLIKAESYGYYFDRHVKKAGYSYRKVEQTAELYLNHSDMVDSEIAKKLEPPRKQLSLSIDVSATNAIDEISLEIAELCKAINAYHIAFGGTGLDIDEWDILVRLRQLVGV